ncbi:MAG: FecR family protein [Melioribacteraceae bacterium]
MRAKSLLIIFMLPLLLAFSSDENLTIPGDTPVAFVKKIVKDVTYKKAGEKDWEFAKTGLSLMNDEEVKTGSKSLALVLFTDNSGLLRVRENSILHIYGKFENKKIDKNTFIQKGLIGFEVNKQENEEFKFTTPTAVASIRGTLGFIEVDSDSSTKIFLEHGSLDFQSTKGQNGTLTGGNTAVINKDGNISYNENSDGDKKKNDQTKNLNTKRVKIMTNQGEVIIEYYSSGN